MGPRMSICSLRAADAGRFLDGISASFFFLRRFLCFSYLCHKQLVLHINFDKGNKGLGFSIAGGLDDCIEEGDPSIYVTNILSNHAAAEDGRLRVHDRLIEGLFPDNELLLQDIVGPQLNGFFTSLPFFLQSTATLWKVSRTTRLCACCRLWATKSSWWWDACRKTMTTRRRLKWMCPSSVMLAAWVSALPAAQITLSR